MNSDRPTWPPRFLFSRDTLGGSSFLLSPGGRGAGGEGAVAIGSGEIIFDFFDGNTSDSNPPELHRRYLAALDRVFAQENLFVDDSVSNTWNPNGAPIGTYWLIADRLGTVRNVIDNNRVIWNHAQYDAFGNRVSLDYPHTSPATALSRSITRIGFTGQEYDEVTGLTWYSNGKGRGRWYDARTNTFIQPDAIGVVDGPHVYAYVHNGPTNFTDSNGQEAYPGGAWNPGNWNRWLYTGDANAPDEVYDAATAAAGDYYVNNAGATHEALNGLPAADKIPLGQGTSAVLELIEGEELHAEIERRHEQQEQQAGLPPQPNAQADCGGAPAPVPGQAADNLGRKFTDGVAVVGPYVAFALAIAGMLPEEDPLHPYDVGTYDELQDRSNVGDGLDIHHMPQAHPAEQVIPGYDRETAPCIALPSAEHQAIPKIRGTYPGTGTELIEQGITDLETLTNASPEQIEKLRELIRQMYGI